MGLMDQLKKDIEQIAGNTNEFAVNLLFTSKTGETAEIKGLYSDHSNAFDENGNPMTGKFTHVTISEKYLTDLDYPTRNANNFLNMKGHLVTVSYADGSTKRYYVDDQRPDYTINLHTLILAEYNGAD